MHPIIALVSLSPYIQHIKRCLAIMQEAIQQVMTASSNPAIQVRDPMYRLVTAGYLAQKPISSVGLPRLAMTPLPDWLTNGSPVPIDLDLYIEVYRLGYEEVLDNQHDFTEAKSWFHVVENVDDRFDFGYTSDQCIQIAAAITVNEKILTDPACFMIEDEAHGIIGWSRDGQMRMRNSMSALRSMLTEAATPLFTGFGNCPTGCLNCGAPEVQFCSEECRDEFSAYLLEEVRQQEGDEQ